MWVPRVGSRHQPTAANHSSNTSSGPLGAPRLRGPPKVGCRAVEPKTGPALRSIDPQWCVATQHLPSRTKQNGFYLVLLFSFLAVRSGGCSFDAFESLVWIIPGRVRTIFEVQVAQDEHFQLEKLREVRGQKTKTVWACLCPSRWRNKDRPPLPSISHGDGILRK